MAKPSLEITKSEFKDNYNVVKIFNDKLSIMKQLETFNPNNQAVAFGIKKKPKDTMPTWFKEWSENVYEKKQPAWFKEWSENVYEKKQPAWFKEWSENVYKADIDSIKTRLDKVELRLDNIVTKNNLIE